METLAMVCLIIAAVGAVNWGLVGLFKFDLVALIAGGKKFGEVNILSRLLYIIVAAAGVIAAVHYF
jgi:uncharacterized membrane protein YuzA (DUF378 family)